MSCPSWSRLVAEREASGVDPQGWSEALNHLDHCPRCSREAPDVDPLLLFRRLPAPKIGSSDVEAMKLGVAAMIRASRVESFAVPSPARSRSAGRSRWRLSAAVAAVLVTGLGLGALQSSRLSRPSSPGSGQAPAGIALAAWSAPAESSDLEGTIEDLSLVDARVYEVASEGISVVTIVHPSLDW